MSQSLTWYALKSRPNCERKAESSLKDRGFSVYVPMETRWRRSKAKDKRERHDRPLIPGYMFVGLSDGASLYFALQADGVASVVGWGGHARVIRPSFVYDLQARQVAGEFHHTPARRLNIKPGEKARILSGPFRDQIGQLVSADDNGRVTLFLEGIFSGNIAIDGDAVERAA